MPKKIIFLTICFFSFLTCFSQEYKIVFSYDNAGNQTLRHRVCVNCDSAARSIVDSIVTVASTDIEDELIDEDESEVLNSKITAYPNPVTDILKIEWNEIGNKVKQVSLFSGFNKQLINSHISSGQSSLDLNFSNYSSGLYFVIVIYADNSKKSFKVIKK